MSKTKWSSGTGSNDGKAVVIEPIYTGHPYDPILGIYFAEARFYDADNRQWMASDPIRSGLNWYEYVGSNPATYWDFNGLWEVYLNQEPDKNPPDQNPQYPGPYDHRPELSDEEIAQLIEHDKEIQLQKRQKKQEKKEAYEREVIKAVTEQKRRREKEQAEWEAYYANPVEPYQPLKEFYKWNVGRQNNFNEATMLYFERITCPIRQQSIMDILSDPNRFALQYTINAGNETIQYFGQLSGYYEMTGIANLNVGVGLGDWTHGASLGIAYDMKGNIWLLTTKSDGASLAADTTPGWNLDGSLSIMPGGKIENWEGSADNIGGSVTWSGKGIGADYAELIDAKTGERESKFVISGKIAVDEFGLEVHNTHSITESGRIWNTPFNWLAYVDEKSEDILTWLEQLEIYL